MFAAAAGLAAVKNFVGGDTKEDKEKQKEEDDRRRREEEDRDKEEEVRQRQQAELEEEVGQDGGDLERGMTSPEEGNDTLPADDDICITRERFQAACEAHKGKYNVTVGETEAEARLKVWGVRLWKIEVTPLNNDEPVAFLNFAWGGTREEFRVDTAQTGTLFGWLSASSSVWCIGKEAQSLRTGAFSVPKMFTDGVKNKVQIPDDFDFEWRGSYLDLEREHLKIELWQWSKYKANRIDSHHSRLLMEYATGPVLQNCVLGTFHVDDTIYFQEIYDFELHLLDWTLRDLPTVEELIARIKAAKGGYEEIDANIDKDDLQHEEDIFAESASEGSTDDEGQALQSNADGFDALSRLRRARKTIVGGGSFLVNSASMFSELENDGKSANAERRGPTASSRLGFQASIKRNFFEQWKSFFSMSIRSDYIKRESAMLRWPNVGKIYYRGTLADVDSETLRVEVVQRSKKHGLYKNTPIAEALISLRGVHEYGHVSAMFGPPAWFAKELMKIATRGTQQESKEAIGRMLQSGFGKLGGKIGVDHRPHYRQTGELCDMAESKAYLLVRVIKVDKILTPQQRPLSEMDTYVQVTFDGMSYVTDVVQDDLRPEYKQDFYFEIRVANTTTLDPREVLAKGPVTFDVWLDASDSSGVGGTDHCGWAKMDLSEIFNDGLNILLTTLVAATRQRDVLSTGLATDYQTKVLHLKRRLKCLWMPPDEDAEEVSSKNNISNIYVEAWIRPFDFPDDYRVPDVPDSRPDYLPPKLIAEWPLRIIEWNNHTEPLKVDDNRNRQFIYQLRGQRGRLHYLPSFLDVIKPPSEVDNRNAVYFWVRCFPYVNAMPIYESLALAPGVTARKHVLPNVKSPVAEADEATAELPSGSYDDESQQKAGPMLVGETAFVCIGTTWDRQPAYWVMTMEFDCSVTFWDATIGRRYSLPKRFADAHRCKRTVVDKRPPGRLAPKEAREAEVTRRKRLLYQKLLRQRRKSQLKAIKEERRRGTSALMRASKGVDFSIDASVDASMLIPPTDDTSVDDSSFGSILSNDDEQHPDQEMLDATLDAPPNELLLLNSQHHQHPLRLHSSLPLNLPCTICGSYPSTRNMLGFLCHQAYPITNSTRPLRGKEASSARLGVNCTEILICWDCSGPDFEEADSRITGKNLHWKDGTWKPVSFNEHPLMPYRTIDIIFNKSNVWANMQTPEPTRIYYDLWNNNYWHPFSTTISEIPSFFSDWPLKRLARIQESKREVYQHVRDAIEAYRQNQSSAVVWQKDAALTHYLERGLQLMFACEIAADHDRPIASERVTDWRRLLYSKVPTGMNLICLPMFVNYTSPKDVGDSVVARCPFLNCREAGTQFTIAVHINRMPNRLVALYVCVAMIHNLTDLQIQEVLARREKQERQRDVFADEDNINLIRITEMKETAWDARDSDDILTREASYLFGVFDEIQTGEEGFQSSTFSRKSRASFARASVLNDAHRENAVPRLSGWAPKVHSSYVKISDYGRIAKYKKDMGPSKNDVALGMVIGDGPIEHFRFAGLYFEVELLEIQEPQGHWVDGLTLGATTATPEDVMAEGVPSTVADLDSSWTIGYDGSSYNSVTDTWEDLENGWNPVCLKPGDRIGLFISKRGDMVLVLNGGERLIQGPKGVPVHDAELYPIADLIGSAATVALVLGAEPPRSAVELCRGDQKRNQTSGRPSASDSGTITMSSMSSDTLVEENIIKEYTRVKEIVEISEQYNKFPDGTYMKHYDSVDGARVEEDVYAPYECMDFAAV
ncbi:hypothetical protein FOL47_001894 [Perkinsus chesapeaki]|uniref:C2 domain-containing protein n=1 Tax=Perkinsus chesapeaki TaxID=330153 RepID=A0A7J6MG62_PERCH|nr:hypothetical protein FOL47_001894 [Perkinsus chesapeaki]